MSSTRVRSTRIVSPVEVYVTTVHQEILRLTSRAHGVQVPPDVAQDVVVTLLGKVHAIMARYSNPVVYARVAYRHAVIQAGRRDRVQRGEGSRLYQRADGSRTPGHQVVSGDSTGPNDGRTLFDTLVDDNPALDDHVCALVDNRHRLAEVLTRVPATDRAAYFMVRGLGYPVAEVAERIGVRRETLQRRLGRVEVAGHPLRSDAG